MAKMYTRALPRTPSGSPTRQLPPASRRGRAHRALSASARGRVKGQRSHVEDSYWTSARHILRRWHCANTCHGISGVPLSLAPILSHLSPLILFIKLATHELSPRIGSRRGENHYLTQVGADPSRHLRSARCAAAALFRVT